MVLYQTTMESIRTLNQAEKRSLQTSHNALLSDEVVQNDLLLRWMGKDYAAMRKALSDMEKKEKDYTIHQIYEADNDCRPSQGYARYH